MAHQAKLGKCSVIRLEFGCYCHHPHAYTSYPKLQVPVQVRYSDFQAVLTPSQFKFCHIQGSSYLLVQRFSTCFVLKFALQRGDGEKREECKFQNKTHRTFDLRNTLNPVYSAAPHLCIFRKFKHSGEG